MKSIFRWTVREARRPGLVACCAAMLFLHAPQALIGGAVGRVVAIGGHASDLAIDEARGVLYVANFTANRIEVMSLGDGSVQTSLNVASQPSAISLSPDARYLVVAHYGNFQAPATTANGLTVIDLSNNNARQSFVLGSPPLGVAFGVDNRALVATATEFLLFDPATGNTQTLGTISNVTTKALPQPLSSFPTNVVGASMASSGDGLWIYGSAAVAGQTGSTANVTLEFGYNVTTRSLQAYFWTWAPPPGPRVVSVNFDGSLHMTGWAVHDRLMDIGLNQLTQSSGAFHIGTHVFDNARGLVYAQYAETPRTQQAQQTTPPPVLLVLDAESFAVRERLGLTENFSGKSLLNSDSSVLYGISDSGIMIVPIGDMSRVPRVVANRSDVVFRGNFCDRRISSQEVTLLDPSGGNTDFTLTVSTPGITVTPSRGVTPATIRINVDPNTFQNQKGTVAVNIEISSSRGANLPNPIRVLINNREPDQRGTIVNLAGTLVDLISDPARDRFYVLRQDTNQVLVYDGATQTQIAALKTANVPTQMAVTFDRRHLLVGHDAAQLIKVYDLETLEESLPVRMPSGHYPRSVAASGKAILAASRVSGPKNKISRVDFLARLATELPTLGVYENDISVNTVLVAAPNGGSILVAQADGNLMQYNANADTFTISRKHSTTLSGAYAASSFDQFVIGNTLLNASLVPVRSFETTTGRSSGFAFLDQGGFRTTAPDQASPGVIQRVDPATGSLARATRMIEAPVLPLAVTTGQQQNQNQDWQQTFTRTVAPLYSRNAVVNLTTSGFTVLPWNFDAAVAPPRLERVVNAADQTGSVAPGSLVSIFGADLSPVNQATQQMPLPTALGESCLTVNGVPVPVIFVSPRQINGQLPFPVDGNVTMILRTPGGVSDNFNLTILPTAPGVFRNATAGTQRDLPAVFRSGNGLLVTPSNPVHRGDTISIYLTGMGRTSPAVDAGVPAPDPPASVVIAPAVSLAGVDLPIDFAGLMPGSIGVYQINARVPHHVRPGLEQALIISQGSSATTLSVRVID